ncbi:phytoene/squalene synthase family protein [Caenibius sp. WL]|uniref:phytoene/squalene synthase family protein n=1 Tax=Caenibius sp. WL TaxID=2872646 RepID=UPI001C98FB48|nr:phytoene/squalene synthase family protein [Caenibius sp. WL]QZP07652.1 phytoene/squalene synthase family protein [Caenibius sp. WL]
MSSRAEIVRFSKETISVGSQSFAAASALFAPDVRERCWMLYAWCRAADDLTDGQTLGHDAGNNADPDRAHAFLQEMTARALDSDEAVPPPFEALRHVVRETNVSRGLIEDHLAGFALDASQWRAASEQDLLQYCYHVAGSVGCMMAIVMGVPPGDEDTLDRACDLGIAFQLSNIARDIIPDAQVGRYYLPDEWLREHSLDLAAISEPENREIVAVLAARLIGISQPYHRSARIGALKLPFRSRLAVLMADGVYGAIGQKVVRLGSKAWDQRVSTRAAEKFSQLAVALGRGVFGNAPQSREGLFQRPR